MIELSTTAPLESRIAAPWVEVGSHKVASPVKPQTAPEPAVALVVEHLPYLSPLLDGDGDHLDGGGLKCGAGASSSGGSPVRLKVSQV